MNRIKGNWKYYIILHVNILLYSLGTIASKLASQQQYLSQNFFFFYALAMLSLVIYAIAWQVVLKKIPLHVAFLNKAIVIFWTMLWGRLIFLEQITWNMLIGAAIVCFGVSWVVTADE